MSPKKREKISNQQEEIQTQQSPLKKKRIARRKKTATSVAAKSGKTAKASVDRNIPQTSLAQNLAMDVRIDHPSDGETIGRAHYAVRISCGGYPAGGVEVSIDGAEYVPARESVGFWWYDWCDIPEGSHTIVVRAKEEDGSIVGKSRIIKVIAR